MQKYIIGLLLIVLIVTVGVNQVMNVKSQEDITKEKVTQKNAVKKDMSNTKNKNVETVEKKEKNIYNKVKPESELETQVEVEKNNDYIIMQATAYDLSIQCCSKPYNHPSRGVTKSGYDLNNKSHSQAWTVSSTKFPMGTKLQLKFPESHKKYNGIYTVRDNGDFGKNILDIYIGDFGEKVHQDTINFGRVNVKVLILKE